MEIKIPINTYPLILEINYLLTPRSTVLLEKLTGFQLVKKFPTLYGTRRFITAFTSARQLSLPLASSIQSITPHPTSWKSILILCSHPRLCLPSRVFISGLPIKTLYTPLLSPIRATYPAHLILLDFITRTILGDQYRSLSFSFCYSLHSPVSSSLLGPNILFNTLFWNTLSLLSSLNVSDQVSHPYKTTGKIIFQYILIFKFLDRKLEDKRFCKNDNKHSMTSICSYEGADNSLARPERKQATATQIGIYSTYSPRSSIHLLVRCSSFCKPLKKKNS